MYPNAYRQAYNGTRQSIYVQVYKAGVTEYVGQGANISCSLHWSEVDYPGGPWKKPMETPMNYNIDIGNNDEYTVTITPTAGLYEFTTFCTDSLTSSVVWQAGGNGLLVIDTAPSDRRAFWLEDQLIAWNRPGGYTYELHYDPSGELTIPPVKGSGIPLSYDHTLNAQEYEKFPQLDRYDTWRIPDHTLEKIPDILKSEMAIAAYDRFGDLLDTTSIQIQGILDQRYRYDGELGVLYTNGIPTLKVWAPTAQAVTLKRFPQANTPPESVISSPMTLDPATGVWSIKGDSSWDKQYYLYSVKVFMPQTGRMEENLVTDPYSVNLSQNSQRSQIVDLYGDPSLKPPGWDNLVKPPFTVPEDMAIYEMHIRNFSRDDETVAPEHRGTFNAFTYDGHDSHHRLSNGMAHLLNLAKAGLTHVHLMPAFDFASVNENPEARTDADYKTLNLFSPNGICQESVIMATQDQDSFNWGYDPFHYGVPEGSYTTEQNGTNRVLEFREMVQSLSENGLRVVMDMVYNHTAASNLYTESVLDKVVPGYYFRYTSDGKLYTTSCCSDTASEFAMMQKHMVDTLVRWVKAYKVDGFRFDLMNLHTVENMVAVRDQLQSLTLEKDGVDGQGIYLYGEGWDFGSAKEKGLHYANQYNMTGTGIGTFNDKIRDAAHGGYALDNLGIRRQGFINGQSFDWNGFLYRERERQDLRFTTDRLRIGLAGSLRNYWILNQNGQWISGQDLAGVGYTVDPQETINYVSKHDNQTLFDLNLLKLPMGQSGMSATTLSDRVRVQNLGLSIVGLSQGVPFFHMGSDMLRSKSLDRNSYNSGDWFNRVDFTYSNNNFGIGLPVARDNEQGWSIMGPLLGNPQLKPTQEDILNSAAHLQEILKIRKSSKLFRLETAEDIQKRLHFHNMGPYQQDALIVMSLKDDGEEDLDPNYESIVVFFNADKFPKSFGIPELINQPVVLHPVQENSQDPLVRTATFDRSSGVFVIPSRTTAVFVLPEAPLEQG